MKKTRYFIANGEKCKVYNDNPNTIIKYNGYWQEGDFIMYKGEKISLDCDLVNHTNYFKNQQKIIIEESK